MREKDIKNYYMFINNLAIDVCKIKGTPYIKVADREIESKRLLFTMNLELVSANVDTTEVDRIKLVLERNLSLLQDREKELK